MYKHIFILKIMYTLSYILLPTIFTVNSKDVKDVSFNITVGGTEEQSINWGDNTQTTIQPQDTSISVNHTYQNSGSFKIKFPQNTTEIEHDNSNVEDYQFGSSLKQINIWVYTEYNEVLSFEPVSSWVYEKASYSL